MDFFIISISHTLSFSPVMECYFSDVSILRILSFLL